MDKFQEQKPPEILYKNVCVCAHVHFSKKVQCFHQISKKVCETKRIQL